MKTSKRFAKSSLVAAVTALTFAFGATAATAATGDITWHSATVTNGSSYYNSVAYGNGHWVAINGSGDVSVSTDGVSWVDGGTQLHDNYFNDIVYGNGKFVAIGDSSSAVSTDNGATWTFDSNGVDNYYYHVAYGNGTFVAAEGDNCGGNAAYSTDGTNWTEVDTASDNVCWQDVAFGNGKFVMVNDNSIDVSSDNGATWTRVHDNSDLGNQGIRAVDFGNGKWIALGYKYGSGNPIEFTSTDGTNWTETQNVPVLEDGHFRTLLYTNGMWIAGENTSNIGDLSTAVSVDGGVTWTGSMYEGYGIRHFASDGNQLVYVGEFYGSTPPTGRTDSAIAYTVVPGSSDSSSPSLANTGTDGNLTAIFGLVGMVLIGAGVMLVRRKA